MRATTSHINTSPRDLTSGPTNPLRLVDGSTAKTQGFLVRRINASDEKRTGGTGLQVDLAVRWPQAHAHRYSPGMKKSFLQHTDDMTDPFSFYSFPRSKCTQLELKKFYIRELVTCPIRGPRLAAGGVIHIRY